MSSVNSDTINTITYCIDKDSQVFEIGLSADFAFCKGASKNLSLTGLPSINANLACRVFVNSSIEKVCDSHKEIRSENNMARIRSQRVGMHTDYLDINKIHKMHILEEKERKINAFNPFGFAAQARCKKP